MRLINRLTKFFRYRKIDRLERERVILSAERDGLKPHLTNSYYIDRYINVEKKMAGIQFDLKLINMLNMQEGFWQVQKALKRKDNYGKKVS